MEHEKSENENGTENLKNKKCKLKQKLKKDELEYKLEKTGNGCGNWNSISQNSPPHLIKKKKYLSTFLF